MKKYPIAETFTSPQGEGLHAGTLMHFIRFAGCSVGKKLTPEERMKLPGSLPVYIEKCTTYDGREFLCDTNFQTKEVKTIEELLAGIPKGVEHICLTGGEPLNQPLDEFLQKVADDTDYKVHIETSGTVSLTEKFPAYHEMDSHDTEGWLWITVSPKMGLLPEMIGLANEIKLLVDDEFDVAKIPVDILDHHLVWISPINEEFSLNRKNQEKCIKLLYEHPNWRLACQMHKIWGVR